ncbi:hypothetical protein ACQE98_04125 [Ornithinimicrobium sp. W1679]|uniref:hypothetical protein n=1 Tax=unclassified Ornithinimicrobium TaxID=2615080 RepID=UPI003CE77958
MDEQTSTPDQPSDNASEGTFVGGSFGGTQGDEDPGTTTAEQVEAEHDGPVHLADATVPAEVQEQATLTSEPGSIPDEGDAFPADVEGTSGAPSPGERNDPV